MTKRVRNQTHIDDVSLTFANGTLNILLDRRSPARRA